jgi:predicted permease
VSFLPLSGYDAKNRFAIDDRPAAPGELRVAEHRVVSAGYFEAMGIPLLQGRTPDAWDTEESPPVVVISESMARRYWPQGDAVGQRITLANLGRLSRGGSTESVSRQIVGVVGDVRHAGLASRGEPTLYVPYRQDPWPLMSLVMRTEGDPLGVVGAARAEVRALDPNQPVSRVQSLDEAISGSLVQDRFNVLLLGGFAVLAVVLAVIGVYGVMAYSVARRRREIGLRMALGARGGEVLLLFLREAAVIVVVGVGLGLAVAVGVTRFLASLLFEVSVTDPLTFGAVAVGLSAVALPWA